jgi:MFS family permease
MAFTMPAATAAIIEAAPASRVGIASGVLGAARQAGGAIWVALLGTVIARGTFVTGLHEAMGVSAAAFAAGAVVTVVAVRPDRRDACGIMDADECSRRTWLGSGERRRTRVHARDAGRRGQPAPAPDGP